MGSKRLPVLAPYCGSPNYRRFRKTGELTFPKNHQPAVRVPLGGSSCVTCRHFYTAPPGGPYESAIPWDPEAFCSDWYERKSRKV